MSKDKELIAPRDKALQRRNGRVKRTNHLRLLASKHVLRKAGGRRRPSGL
ncbi:MAG: hypothetical protein Q8R28_05960 [Dehalococcoidia bacterium]|nr:hypothetical protein [Dehalococcoidia bacterium]